MMDNFIQNHIFNSILIKMDKYMGLFFALTVCYLDPYPKSVRSAFKSFVFQKTFL